MAEDGLIAFQKYQNSAYDLILMDMQMPELDGIQSTQKIREYEEKNNIESPVYIVAVTANAFAEDKQRCFDAGMNDYISKPFKEEELKKVILNAVQN